MYALLIFLAGVFSILGLFSLDGEEFAWASLGLGALLFVLGLIAFMIDDEEEPKPTREDLEDIEARKS